MQMRQLLTDSSLLQAFYDYMLTDSSLLQEFYDYMLSFYGETGQYANAVGGPFTLKEVEEATARYLAIPTDHRPEFDGDTIDREHVRDIVLIMRGQEPWDYLFTPSLLNRNHLLRKI